MRRKLLGLIIVIVLTTRVALPLFGKGYFPMHDDTQIGRVVAMGKALRWGQFPVRWVSDLGYGYGYPLYNFYGPLPYYFGGLLYALGATGLAATKAMMILGMVLSGVSLYAVLWARLGTVASIAAALFYAFAPYHAVQLYVRGAVGELWTLVFYPLVFWGIVEIWRKNTNPIVSVLADIGLAGVILSHTLLGYATTMFLAIGWVVMFVVGIIRRHPDLRVWKYASLIVTGVSLSAFFWLPAITEMKYTSVAGQIGQSANFRDHFVCLPQLWSSAWGYGGSASGCVDGLSFMLGKLHIIFGVLGGLVLLRKSTRVRSEGTIGLVVALVGIFLSLQMSSLVWELIPLFSYLQYPWRFLVLAIFGLSVLAGVFIASIPGRAVRFIAGVLAVVFAFSVYGKWFAPQYLYEKDPGVFESEKTLRFDVSNISSEYLPVGFIRPSDPNAYARETLSQKEGMRIERIVQSDIYERFTVTTQKDEPVTLNKTYFPGWRYYVNGELVEPVVASALPTIIIPKGLNVVEMRFTNTPIRTLGNIISLIAVCGLFFIYGKKHKETNA